MKTYFLPVFAGVLLLNSCSYSSKGKDGDDGFSFTVSNEGKEPISQKNYNGDFDEIEVATSINAEVYKSNEEKVVISAPADLQDQIKVENNGGKLRIYVESHFGGISTKNVKAKIYAKDFTKLSANSSGNIDVKDTFTQDKVTIDVSSSGDISGNLEANELSIYSSSSGDFSGKIWAVNLNVESSSSGDIAINGKTKNATISSNSSGDVKATDLIAENADLDASSSGDISISVSKSLKANATSSSEITVYRKGDVNAQIEKNSGGEVYLK